MGRLRRDRLAEQLREEISLLIRSLKDPRIGFTSVLRVDLSEDLRHAKVRVSVLGPAEDQKRTMAGLRSAVPHLRSELGRRLSLRYVPEIVVILDRSLEEEERLDGLLRGPARTEP